MRVDTVWTDVAYSLRTLYRRPMFAFAVVLTLVLGFGINIALFNVVNTVLLQPLPYPAPERLVSVWEYSPQTQHKFPELPVRARDFAQWKKFSPAIDSMAALAPTEVNLTGSGEPERLGGARVSANIFDVLGIQPELGRTFLPEEDQPGSDRVVLISHALWVARFGADRRLVNQTITLDGQNFTVIGIMPADLLFPAGKQLNPYLPLPERISLWKPMAFSPDELQTKGSFNYGVIARLKPGETISAAEAQLTGVSADLAKEISGPLFKVKLDSLKEAFINKIRTNLLLLFGASLILLLLACTNLANLMIMHINGRKKEFSTRRALGCSSWRVVQQVLTESMVLALIAGAVGIFVSHWITQILLAAAPANLPRIHTVHLNINVIFFAFLLSLLAGAIIGTAPAIRLSLQEVSYSDLKDSGRTTRGRSSRALQHGMVIAEIAGSTGLLIAAGLLLHSFVNVTNVDAGFTAENVITMEVTLPASTYSVKQRIDLFRDLTDRLMSLPGVISVGAITHLPLSSESDTSAITLRDQPAKDVEKPIATFRGVTPGYFRTMGINLRTGRFFNQADIDDASADIVNMVISESLARRLWGDAPFESVVGRSFIAKGRDMRVIGVAAEVKNGGLDHDPLPQAYIPPQYSEVEARRMTLVLRTRSDPKTLAPSIRAEIWKLDKSLPVSSMRAMKDIVSESLSQRWFAMILVVAFALLALGLASLGTYTVLSYSVSQTTQELGIRMAMGAQRSEIVLYVLKAGLQPAFAGLLIGIGLALVLSKLMNSFLFGIKAFDPVTLVIVPFLLLTSAMLASYVPALRASSIDPAAALRSE
ncbi:MAG TPA: ABC transporter permease [Candidatus Angelobacter sp.]|nr:ABC transporter permease [Candidatus Angelobacter sp.]